ncbi:adenylosuccinate lyase [Capsaspora owczarzaki ATCC 30864]|nr:adenylosuccinate lyase [Capsaspora owczarzaki ATCC 30864]|eukprot:XP_004345340.1 adenylosuccinate lyase [Capsaspora owczarzaki ATCC 30864]
MSDDSAAVLALTALSPIDGRYRSALTELVPIFSEFALQRYRVKVEVEYFIALAAARTDGSINSSPSSSLPFAVPALAALVNEYGAASMAEKLRELYQNFSTSSSLAIKRIEEKTRHDVKAVEMWLRDQFDQLGLPAASKEFIHFGLTSQDVNNTSIPLSLQEATNSVLLPKITTMILQPLHRLATEWWDIPMLARTHGQPATPTRLGKEIGVFVERLVSQLRAIKQIPFSAKFGGATGGFNAHVVAFPGVDWVAFGNNFVNSSLQLSRSQLTTQIEHYDNLAALLDAYKRVNTILIDLCRDIWTYIAMEMFGLKTKAGEVGSSAMPHKVNPIDFENAEGNLGVANALFEFLSSKLPISRQQRDLTDSTVLRNLGVAFGHSLQSYVSISRGLDKLQLRKETLERDLHDNWVVVAEAIQTVLRNAGVDDAYTLIKEATRTGAALRQPEMEAVIRQLNVDDALKQRLLGITPFSYAPQLPALPAINLAEFGVLH